MFTNNILNDTLHEIREGQKEVRQQIQSMREEMITLHGEISSIKEMRPRIESLDPRLDTIEKAVQKNTDWRIRAEGRTAQQSANEEQLRLQFQKELIGWITKSLVSLLVMGSLFFLGQHLPLNPPQDNGSTQPQ